MFLCCIANIFRLVLNGFEAFVYAGSWHWSSLVDQWQVNGDSSWKISLSQKKGHQVKDMYVLSRIKSVDCISHL